MTTAPLVTATDASSSSSDSVYGTFPHSDNLEATKRSGAAIGTNKPINNNDDDDDDDGPQECGCEQGDCCFVMALLCAPVRLQTYKVLLFHTANVALALLSPAWMLAAAVGAKLTRGRNIAQHSACLSLHSLLRADAALLNFVSPPHERVQVHDDDALSSSSRLESGAAGQQHEEVSDADECVGGAAPLFYFGGAKVACCALPGAVAAVVFIGALQRLLVVALCVLSAQDACDTALLGNLLPPSGGARHFLATAAQDRDVLVLLAVLAVYFATLLLRVAAYVSRHAALYFCGDHLRYQSSVGINRSGGGSSSSQEHHEGAS